MTRAPNMHRKEMPAVKPRRRSIDGFPERDPDEPDMSRAEIDEWHLAARSGLEHNCDHQPPVVDNRGHHPSDNGSWPAQGSPRTINAHAARQSASFAGRTSQNRT